MEPFVGATIGKSNGIMVRNKKMIKPEAKKETKMDPEKNNQ